MYDYVIVGSGLFGCVFAHEMHQAGRQCLVLERRDHVGGNVYCEEKDGIHIHRYGAHIFHTSDRRVWDYVNQFVEFNHFINAPIANYKGELYNLPFNMNTFAKMWGIVTPEQAAAKIEGQRRAAGITEPKNLEEQAISLIGTDIYTKLIKGYTESSGVGAARTARRSSSSACPCAILSTIIISTDCWQASPKGATMSSSTPSWKASKCGLASIITANGRRTWI